MTRKQYSLYLVSCTVAALIGGALVNLVFQGNATVYAQQERVLRATRFELIDASGNERGVMSVSEGGFASLEFRNAEGEQIILGLHENGREVLRFLGPQNRVRTVLRAHRNGLARLVLFGKDGKTAAVLELDENGKPLLGFLGESGERIWSKP